MNVLPQVHTTLINSQIFSRCDIKIILLVQLFQGLETIIKIRKLKKQLIMMCVET